MTASSVAVRLSETDYYKTFVSGVTILLSLTVFLLLVAETMPPTSDAVPLIGRSRVVTSSPVNAPVIIRQSIDRSPSEVNNYRSARYHRRLSADRRCNYGVVVTVCH